MSETLATLMVARTGLKAAVLNAMLAETTGDFSSVFTAWQEVDQSAAKVAAASRKHKRHCQEVARNFPGRAVP